MKYLRRFVWYLASRLLLICVVLGLMVVAFYYAMNMANIYVVLKDGMAYRAQVVMMEADESELTKYFMPSFLEQDQVLLASKQGNSPIRITTSAVLTTGWKWNGCGVGPGRIPPGRILSSAFRA